LEKNTGKFIQYRGELSRLIKNDTLEFMIKDNRGAGLWAITDDALIQVKDHKVVQVLDLNKEVKYSRKIANTKIYQDNTGSLWLTGDSGLIRFYKGKFDFFSNADGLSDDITFSAYQDKEGNLWVGTRPGLDQFSESKFTIYSQAEGLFDDTVNATLEDKPGEFLVATNQGLNLVIPRLKKVKNFSENILRTRIRHLYKDHSGRVWVSTYGNGVLILKDRKIIQQVTVKNGLAADRVRLVLEDRKYNIWVGTLSGLSRIDPKGDITNFTTNNETGLINDFILSLYEDRDGRIWIGTDGGGIHIYENGRITQKFTKNDGILGNVIFRFHDDSEGGIWVTTNNGISIIKNGEIHNLTSKQGLLTDSVFEILTDSQNRLWMTTTLGVFYVNRDDVEDVVRGKKDTFKIVVFDKKSGFKENPTSNAWTETDAEGNFWIATFGGVATVNPDNIPINKISPKTIILSSNIDALCTEKNKGISKVPPNTPRLNFHFAVLSFVSPEKNMLRFKLDGFDQEWSDPSKKREVSYTNLPPGNYVFRVKGMNNDGVPSLEEATLRFYKTPYYYETAWFRIAMMIGAVTLFALTGGGVYRYRIKKLNEKLERQKFQIELEKKATEAERIAKEQEIELSESYSRFVPHGFLNVLGKESLLNVVLGDQVERTMSILFADIRDFTTISEGLTPKGTFDFINSYLGQIAPIVQQSDGFIDKYIGDAIMALFSSAQQALHAAVHMNKTLLSADNQHRIKNHQQPIAIGIGINTGNLMLGTVGERHRMDGTVISDAVNLASRVEHLTKYYGVNILFTEDTYRDLSDPAQWNIRELDKVTVKGKTRPVTIYEAMDGLPENIKALKIESKPDFEKAIIHYRSGELGRAKEIFQRCLSKYPEDRAAAVYIRRCDHYLENGIENHWDGVSRLDFK
jgi:class 3 adenylate cyclase/ligand-binding sensor domain-containing protein